MKKNICMVILMIVLTVSAISCSKSNINQKQTQQSQSQAYTVNNQVSTSTPSNELSGFDSEWAGKWVRVGSNQFVNSQIEIKNVTASGFQFVINAFSGANGTISDSSSDPGRKGNAVFKGNNAIYQDTQQNFTMTFSLSQGNLIINTSELAGYFGAGVVVEGTYQKGLQVKSLTLRDLGVFCNDNQQQEFKNLVGNDYSNFTGAFDVFGNKQDSDGVGASVYSGFVQGIAPYDAAIIMYTTDGKIWAAFTDGNNIRYYTNTADTSTLPKTIDAWRKGVDNVPVKYMDQ